MTPSDRPPLTDSPWFWVLLFSVVGLIAVAAISGQYGKRQARLERQYQARERIAEGTIGEAGQREYASPERTLIPLWPLALVLGGVGIASAVMLGREYQIRQRESVPPVVPTGVAQPSEASDRAFRSETST
jgi:hypothetical protein